MRNAIKSNEVFTDVELHIYSIYRSEFNKESLINLQWGMTLDEFLVHRNFIEQQEDLRDAMYRDEELKSKHNR